MAERIFDFDILVLRDGKPTYEFILRWDGVLDDLTGHTDSIETLNTQVSGLLAPTSAYGAMTGTATRSAIATYTAPTISDPPTQAQVQAIANALQALSRRVKAIGDDLQAKDILT